MICVYFLSYGCLHVPVCSFLAQPISVLTRPSLALLANDYDYQSSPIPVQNDEVPASPLNDNNDVEKEEEAEPEMEREFNLGELLESSTNNGRPWSVVEVCCFVCLFPTNI